MDYELLLDKSLQIGHDLLVNGAEISRVDDTLAHIYKAYGIKVAEPSSLILTYIFLQ